MSRRQRSSQRGAALLIVLATLILALSASVTLVRLASTAKASRDVGDRAVMADELLRAVDAPILDWLKTKSSSVILPPEATMPQVDVLHDVWVVDDTKHELQVTAWDQLGMVPIGAARSGSPLRLALPAEVRRAVDYVQIPRGEAPGLDLFSARRPASVALFPDGADGDRLIFGPAEQVWVSDRPARLQKKDEREAVGAYIATHNPGRINVNTAPIELVDQALRVSGRGGLDQIVEARADGRSAAPAGGREASGNRGRTTVQLTSSSTAWAFRIDTSVGATQGASVRRSWWAVYARSGSNWECVQRLAILK